METNLEQQTPKLNVTNVSSAVFGKDGSALGEESKIGKLSRIVRTTRLKVNQVEKILPEHQQLIGSNATKIKSNTENIKINADKITRLKKILQTQKSDIGKKLPDSTENKDKAQLNTTLSETNRILVEIQKQLAQDFGAREQEAKEESEDAKEETSKQRFKREETALEKSAKSIVSTAKKATKKVASPLGNIFQKILAFIGILGKGIALNAAFAWFQDPENQKKITKFFNILKENWKLLRNIFLTVVAAGVIIKVVGALTALGGVLAFLANPVVLASLALLLGALSVPFIMDKISADERKKTFGEGNMDKGLFVTRALNNYGRKATKKNREENLSDQEKREYLMLQNYNKMLQDRQRANQDLFAARKNKKGAEVISGLEQRLQGIDKDLTMFERGEGGVKIQGQTVGKLFEVFKATGLVPQTSLSKSGLQYRAEGGPVMAGNTYLVGENGPELFSPNIDGSIVNNMRTEKIYQMLASGKKGRTRIVNLPPQVIEGPKPEVNVNQGPATKAPTISSSNPLDGSRLVTPEIYGISV